MEIIVNSPHSIHFNSPVSQSFSTASCGANSPMTFTFPCEVRSPMERRNGAVDSLIHGLLVGDDASKLQSLKTLHEFILSLSEEDHSSFRVYFRQIFELVTTILTSIEESAPLVGPLIECVHGLLQKQRQVTVFAHCDDYIARYVSSNDFGLLSKIVGLLEQTALSTGLVNVLWEISCLNDPQVNKVLADLGACVAMADILLSKPEASEDFLNSGLSFLVNVTGDSAVNDKSLLAVAERFSEQHSTKREVLVVELVANIYKAGMQEEVISSNTILKYCEKLLYMSSPSEVRKIEAIVELLSAIVRDLDAEVLQKMNVLDCGFMLVQIMTERMHKDSSLTENFGLKYNIMGILGKMILADTCLFNFLAEDPVFLKLLLGFMDCDNLRFQQCVSFFINNLLISAHSGGPRKERKMREFFLVDELAHLAPQMTSSLARHRSTLLQGSTSQKETSIINAIQVTFVQILQLLVRSATSFDKLQMIQYNCLDIFMAVLQQCAQKDHRDLLLLRLSLSGLYSMMGEYMWLVSEQRPYQDNYIKQVPAPEELLMALSRYDQCNDPDVRVLIVNVKRAMGVY